MSAAAAKRDYKQQYNSSTLKTAAIDRAYNRLKHGHLKQDALVTRIVELCRPFLDAPLSHQCVEERLLVIERQLQQLEVLKAIPNIEQRTPEWYEARKRLVTASSLAQALGLGKYKSQKDLIIEKCGYKEVPFMTAPPLIWGTKYEPVAGEIYKRRNNTELYEFGLIPHPTISFFGASPDGITDCGTMLEIKCPYMRKITGEIPQEYFYQIQGQLDVCDLNECDYVECTFQEYSGGFPSFAVDTQCVDSDHYTIDMCEKGVFLEYRGMVNKTSYIYGPVNTSPEVAHNWVVAESERLYAEGAEIVKETYWKLAEYMCKRVFRDQEFMTTRYLELEQVWNRILLYRQNKELYDREIEPPTSGQNVKTISIRGGSKRATTLTDTPITIDLDTNPQDTKIFQTYAFKSRASDDW